MKNTSAWNEKKCSLRSQKKKKKTPAWMVCILKQSKIQQFQHTPSFTRRIGQRELKPTHRFIPYHCGICPELHSNVTFGKRAQWPVLMRRNQTRAPTLQTGWDRPQLIMATAHLTALGRYGVVGRGYEAKPPKNCFNIWPLASNRLWNPFQCLADGISHVTTENKHSYLT